jgi:hypothetical protein
VILMVGSRSGPGVHYPVSELAARYGASVAEETSDWRQAYATVERFPARAAAELGSSALGVGFPQALVDLRHHVLDLRVVLERVRARSLP